MSRLGVRTRFEPSRLLHHRFWIVAVLFFGIGDLATTGIGLGFDGITEVGPLAAPLIAQYGFAALVVLKLAVFTGCYVCWRYMPRPQSVGIPLGLALLGVWVTGWNIQIVLFAVLT